MKTQESAEDVTITPRRLEEYSAAILQKAGLPEDDAVLVATSLVDANLRGIDSHGVTRIPIYVERLRLGLVNPHPNISVLSESGGSLQIDGDNGMGQVVLARSLDIGLDRMSEMKTVSVAVRNSNHYGAGAFFAKRAIAQNAALFLYGNASSTMSAWGGRDRYLGTNPYTFGIPAGSQEPMILDMATSVVARGKIILAAQLGEPIPEGWAVDPDGEPTTDAQSALDGSVLPFGGPKGYGIALMVEVMAGILSGASSGPDVGDLYDHLDRPQRAGAFFTLLDIGAFLRPDQFESRMATLFSGLAQSAPPGGEVMVPGEPEARNARRHEEQGLVIPAVVAAKLAALYPGESLENQRT